MRGSLAGYVKTQNTEAVTDDRDGISPAVLGTLIYEDAGMTCS